MRRKTIFQFLFILTTAIVISSCCSNNMEPRDATAEIIKANEDFTAAFNSQDAQALAAVYTSDGILMPPNSDIIQGTDAIAEFWQAVFDMGISRGELETKSATAYGDVAIEDGRFTLYAGDQKVDHGKYIVIWHKVDGTWKYQRDMWSSNMPLTVIEE